MPFYLLFQQFLFVQGGSVGEPIFVIVRPIWSHEGILKEYQKEKWFSINMLYSFLVKYGQTIFFLYMKQNVFMKAFYILLT